MKKLKYYKVRVRLWNRWRKRSLWSPWKKFLVLIGCEHSPVLNGMFIPEGFKEGMYEFSQSAKKASESIEKLAQALKDKLGVVSPSNPGGRNIQMSFYDEVFNKEEDSNE